MPRIAFASTGTCQGLTPDSIGHVAVMAQFADGTFRTLSTDHTRVRREHNLVWGSLAAIRVAWTLKAPT